MSSVHNEFCSRLHAVESENFQLRFWPALTVLPVSPKKAAVEDQEFIADVKVSGPECVVSGWFLQPEGVGIRGLRAKIGNTNFVARRKHLRLDVAQRFPNRPEALQSGFQVGFQLAPGSSIVRFQFKDDEGKWHTFCSCRIKLSRLWWLPRRPKRLLPATEYEEWCARHSDSMLADLIAMRDEQKSWSKHPVISVLMPVYDPEPRWLQRAIDTVAHQVYPHWELCIADDCSPNLKVRALLKKAAEKDPRIKVCFRDQNGHICHASNSALEMCRGEFTALLDHDDELTLDALFQVAREIIRHPEAGVIFSDEDKIDENGRRSGPYFKPGANCELLLSQNVVSHFGVFRTSLLREIGGFRPGYEGSQDWDLTLRAVEQLPREAVRHVPKVLYHWRTLPESTALSMDAKPYAQDAGRRAVVDHLSRASGGARLEDLANGSWRVRWPLPDPIPRVSVVMVTRDRIDLLQPAVESLLAKTSYSNYELLIVDHGSEEPQALSFLSQMEAEHDCIRVLRADGEFNWARLNNIGAAAARGEVFVFVNNDIVVEESDWLTELAGQSMRPDVGAVGACLLYTNGKVQHAGVVLGMTGVAGHIFRGWPVDTNTFGGIPNLAREVTAVTGACLAVRQSTFHSAGGFDADHYRVNYSDIDFCLKLRARGLRNVFTPHSKLIHHESASRRAMESRSARKSEATAEARMLLDRWPDEVSRDRFFNPNLFLETELPLLNWQGTEVPS